MLFVVLGIVAVFVLASISKSLEERPMARAPGQSQASALLHRFWPPLVIVGVALAVVVWVFTRESDIERMRREGRERDREDSLRLAQRSPAARTADSLRHVHDSIKNERDVAKRVAEFESSGCVKAGRARLKAMHASAAVTTSFEDGWNIIRIGVPMSEDRQARWVELYADGDACAQGNRPRKLEFHDARDRVIARADPVEGVRMTSF